MSDLNILIVEGNIREDSEFFIKAAGASAADNLKNLILKIKEKPCSTLFQYPPMQFSILEPNLNNSYIVFI